MICPTVLKRIFKLITFACAKYLRVIYLVTLRIGSKTLCCEEYEVFHLGNLAIKWFVPSSTTAIPSKATSLYTIFFTKQLITNYYQIAILLNYFKSEFAK